MSCNSLELRLRAHDDVKLRDRPASCRNNKMNNNHHHEQTQVKRSVIHGKLIKNTNKNKLKESKDKIIHTDSLNYYYHYHHITTRHTRSPMTRRLAKSRNHDRKASSKYSTVTKILTQNFVVVFIIMLASSLHTNCQRYDNIASDQLPAEARNNIQNANTNRDLTPAQANTLNQFVHLLMNSYGQAATSNNNNNNPMNRANHRLPNNEQQQAPLNVPNTQLINQMANGQTNNNNKILFNNNNNQRSPIMPLGGAASSSSLVQTSSSSSTMQPPPSAPAGPFGNPLANVRNPGQFMRPQLNQQQAPFLPSSTPPSNSNYPLQLNRINNGNTLFQPGMNNAPQTVGANPPGTQIIFPGAPNPSGNFNSQNQPTRIQVPNGTHTRPGAGTPLISGGRGFHLNAGPLRQPPRTPISLSGSLPALVNFNNNQNAPPALKPVSGFAPSGPPPSLSSSAGGQNPLTSEPTIELNRTAPIASSTSTTTSSTSSRTEHPGFKREENLGDETKPNLTSASSNTSDSTSTEASIHAADSSVSTTTTSVVKTNDNWAPLQGNSSSSSNEFPVVQPESQNQTGSSSNTTRPTQAAGGQRPNLNLAPSPDIVTVPPGYNPDHVNTPPNSYDISVSAQMGGPSGGPSPVASQPPQNQYEISNNNQAPFQSLMVNNNSEPFVLAPMSNTPTPPLISPSSVTTILWSPPTASDRAKLPPLTAPTPQPTSITQPDEGPKTTVTIDQTATVAPGHHRSSVSQASPDPMAGIGNMGAASTQAPTRIRDHSADHDFVSSATNDEQQAVVYGKAAQGKESNKPTPPAQFNATGVTPASNHPATIESSVAGKPYIKSVQMDNQVRPYAAQANNPGSSHQHQQPATGSSTQQHTIRRPFKPSRPMGADSRPAGMHVNSGFTISGGSANQTMPTGDIHDYVANVPPLFQSALPVVGGANTNPSPNEPAKSEESSLSSAADQLALPAAPSTSSPPIARIRRPTFKPKPEKPPIRIDSCIVGDDSSCEVSHNERCITEYGISSCHCKPGFGRLSQLRGPCKLVNWFQLALKIDRLSDDRRLAYNQTLANPNTEEYQFLEFESIQAISWAVQQSSLARKFMGARLNSFFERDSRVWANMSVSFEAANLTMSDPKQQMKFGQELNKLIQPGRNGPPKTIGQIERGPTKNELGPVSRLMDVNECASRELNDCSSNATCTNEFGAFQCQCNPGFEDKYAASGDKSKLGRHCLGCSPSYCSNRGSCSIADGQKQCKCRANFMGARCDIDFEVLVVVTVGTAVGIIILVITFWCLLVFNRRWKREQQKMDAISATSGLTYNYVNSQSTSSSNNSLMSPHSAAASRMPGGGGLGRSGANYQPASHGLMAASNYGVPGQHLYPAGAIGRQALTSHAAYATDQQAIMGSTSSGSSAASQPIVCKTAFAAYQYDDSSGLLIAPASSGGSSSIEQTSPSDSHYMQNLGQHQAAYSGYTLSGHHHHAHPHSHAHHSHGHAHVGHGHGHQHHHSHSQLYAPQQHHQRHLSLGQLNKSSSQQLSQFHADYNTAARSAAALYAASQYRNQNNKENGSIGYYLVKAK